MRKLALLLFIVGFGLILFPILREWHYDWKQEQLLTEMEQAISATNENDFDHQLALKNDNLTQLLMQGSDPETESVESPPVETESTPEPSAANTPPPIGIIEIKKIKVKLPILEGATNENMKFSAVHLKETTKLGEIGNAAIAAHRAHTKGRLFNRLNELEVGDEITVKVNDEQFVYTVFNILKVEPTDISVLGRNDRDKILTLITCDPVINPTKRLIVQAKL
ncbi:class D sortase [Cohnella abietis]|uniref:Class C sortase n=1 Tax=Cohnella abietis TaxID=2507935 RepID=A0A3T1D4T6_9BACL|nr:class D sortase [Cohnella abietis]BBI33126.1 hypothetical protein KCTCHS21_25250 [Cohnella abietis]